ncbi:MAG TPA: outer membrane beta-barrel protein [Chryseolinea sp.]
MKKLSLVVAFLGLVKLGIAQDDFRQAYVITNAGDTTFGFVAYSEGRQIHRACRFKSAEDEKIVIHAPDQIRAFGFANNTFFESKVVKMENQDEQRVFVEAKVRGFVSLFRFDYEYYVEKDNGGLQLLSNENQKVYVNGKAMMHRTNRHISVLSTLLFDCVDLRQRVQNVSLTEKQLIKLIQEYNKCIGKDFATYSPSEPLVKLRVGVSAGINVSNLEFSNADGKYDYLDGGFEGSSTLIIGLSLDVFVPGVSKRLSLQTGALYSKSNYANTATHGTKTSYVTIDLEQLKVPFGLRYTFAEKRFTPYLNAGMSTTFNLSSSVPLTTNYKIVNRIETVYTKDALNVNSLQVGFWGGFGIGKSISKKLDIFTEFRYEGTNGIVDRSEQDQNLSSSIKNIQITLGVRMK